MNRDDLTAELRALIIGLLESQGFELVDLICRYEGSDLFLRILADRPEGGISVGECSNLNAQLSAILEEKDLIRQRYILEVSSPGLDRPLKTSQDFARCINKKAKFFLNTEISGKLEWDGLIKKVESDIVFIEVPAGTLEVPLIKINKAKQIIDDI